MNDANDKRKQHAEEISSRYVPCISPYLTDVMTEISQLPIQDIITIYSNANWTLEKGIIPNSAKEELEDGESPKTHYVKAIAHLKEIIISRLTNANSLWYVLETSTNCPYIDSENSVWIFTEKEYADECVDFYMQQYRKIFQVREIPKDETLHFFGVTAHMMGAETFYVDMGAYAKIVLSGTELVPLPDFTDVPEINRPVMNPVFFRSAAKLLQELRYMADYEGKEETLCSLEDKIFKAFYFAKFLVPVKGMKEALSRTDEGDVLKEKSTFSIPVLSAQGRPDATPAFTDWEEFNKCYSQDEWGGWIWTAEDLLGAPNDTIVINNGSLSFSVTKEMIKTMIEVPKAWFKDIHSENPVHYDCVLGKLELPWNGQEIDIFINYDVENRYRPVMNGIYAPESSDIYLTGECFTEQDLEEYLRKVHAYNKKADWERQERTRVLSETAELMKQWLHPSAISFVKGPDEWLLIYSGDYAMHYEPNSKTYSILKYHPEEPIERRYWWWNIDESFHEIKSSNRDGIIGVFIVLVHKMVKELFSGLCPYQDERCKCYIMVVLTNHGLSLNRELHFDLNVGERDLQFTLNVRPYVKTLQAECKDPRFSYTDDGDLRLPARIDDKDGWRVFCNKLAEKLLAHYKIVQSRNKENP